MCNPCLLLFLSLRFVFYGELPVSVDVQSPDEAFSSVRVVVATSADNMHASIIIFGQVPSCGIHLPICPFLQAVRKTFEYNE